MIVIPQELKEILYLEDQPSSLNEIIFIIKDQRTVSKVRIVVNHED